MSSVLALMACGGADNTDDSASAPATDHVAATTPTSASAPAATTTKVTKPAPKPPVAQAPAPAPAPVVQAQAVPAGLQWRGINLAGAEFGGGGTLPGRYGYQYIYPTVSSVSYYQSKGMNLVRLPFLWERLQPTLNGPFDSAELQRLQDFVAGATAKGVTVLIDPHNYARYRGQLIGSAAVPNAAFGNFWSRLATAFKGNRQVLFGVMNEPFGISTENWVAAANEAIRSIRAAGATNTITVPGNAWTGAHSWYATSYGTSNAQAMLNITDSGHNIVYEVHQYLDSNSSGTSPICVSPTVGADRLAAFTGWLRTNGKRGLLGEFAAGNNDTCKQALAGMLNFIKNNNDVWVGWTYWAGGPWWGDSMFTVEPSNGVDRPQMTTMLPYLN